MLRNRTDPRPLPGLTPAVRRTLADVLDRWVTRLRGGLTLPAPVELPPAADFADGSLAPGLAAARAAFRLPPRGRYELPATLDQKRALERHGGRDYDLIESLGYEQADLLLRHLGQEDDTRAAQDRRATARAKRGRLYAGVFVALVVVDAAIVALLYARGGTLVTQDSVVLLPRHAPTPAPAPAPPATLARAVPAPTPLRSAAFRTDMGYSRAAALARYPDLAVPGSAFNARFVARYQVWQEAHDPRLDRSNWPEVLARECAENPAPAAKR